MKALSFLVSTIITISAAGAMAQTFNIDTSKSKVGFETVKYINTHVKGVFDRYSGTFKYDETDISKSQIDVVISTCSFDTTKDNTGVTAKEAPSRDQDVTQNKDFLDCQKFPQMTFKSTQIFPDGDSPNKMKVVGILTLKGTSRPVTLDVEKMNEFVGPSGEKTMSFNAKTQINRKNFGVDGGFIASAFKLRDDVLITLNVQGVSHEASHGPERATAAGATLHGQKTGAKLAAK